MDKIIWIILVFIAGALLPIQGGVNTKLGKAIESPVVASLISFGIGFLSLIIYTLITKTTFQIDGLKSLPLYLWLGGIFGAIYVTIIVLAFPKLGPAVTFSLIVTGQLTISLILEHFNIMVQQQNSINIYRILGIIMMIGGVVIFRKF